MEVNKQRDLARLHDMVLTNQLIMTRVFEFLPIRDIMNIRFVSRTWMHLVNPIFQTKAVLKLAETLHPGGSGMDVFLQSFATTPASRINFRNYKLTLWTMDDSSNETIAFWEKFGPCIEYLELTWVRFVGVDIVRDILFYYTPNLKQLTIRDCTFYEPLEGHQGGLRAHGRKVELEPNVRMNKNLVKFTFQGGEHYMNLPISWEEVFMAYPNLKNLKFYNVSMKDTDEILGIAHNLKNSGKRNLAIEKLNIFNGDYAASEIPRAVLERLISLHLPIKTLSVDLGVTIHPPTIAKFLECFQNVERLIIYRGPLGTPMEKFPFQVTFPNLQYLELTETVADCLDFLQFMPNLTSLALCEPPEVEPPFLPVDVIDKTELNFAPMPLRMNLNELKIEYDISTGDVKKIVFWFPHVTKAKIHLDNEGFRTVCGEWPQIEELEVLGEKLKSEGITGIVMNDGKQVKYNPNNVTSLKRLRRFVMNNYDIPTTIDDHAVEEGFLKNTFLLHLELCTRKISDACWIKLYNWDQLVTLLPSDGKWENGLKKYRRSYYP